MALQIVLYYQLWSLNHKLNNSRLEAQVLWDANINILLIFKYFRHRDQCKRAIFTVLPASCTVWRLWPMFESSFNSELPQMFFYDKKKRRRQNSFVFWGNEGRSETIAYRILEKCQNFLERKDKDYEQHSSCNPM